MDEKMRIAKAIALAGICSRRDAEKLILEGKVQLNGKIVSSPALNVSIKDEIKINNKVINTSENISKRLWIYHKPKGLVTSHRDEKGRTTVFETLPPSLGRVISIGRLDLNSEGLLLLTNNGELARKLEHPSQGFKRCYRVRIHGEINISKLKDLEKGITIEGISYAPLKVKIEKEQNTITWLNIELSEGKNREIRKIMEHLGLQVTRLIRISYGPFQLRELKPGAVKEVPIPLSLKV